MYTPQSSVNSNGVITRDVWIAELVRRGADEPTQIVDAYLSLAGPAGKNYDIAIAQGIVECTGFTDWKWIQNRNPAGIGSTDRLAVGAVFITIEEGISAQYSHQCAYADTADSCPIEKMGPEFDSLYNDPRHALVNHQGIPTMVHWNGRWAIPGDQYAQDICNVVNAVLGNVSVPPPPPPPVEVAPQMIDMRPILRRNPNGGPNYQNDAKVGGVWHYNGPPPNNDAYVQYQNDAVYHINLNWGSAISPAYGDGIMYHYGIQSGDGGTYPDGTIFQLRDEADVLWHCGAWVPGGNDTGISINTNIGEGENATAAALNSAAWLANDIRSRRQIDAQMFKGHQELSPTACPGTLMDDLVLPYREGKMSVVLPPTPGDGFLHENGHIIGGGFEHIISMLDAVSHAMRMKLIGYAISEEGDGYLMVPETRDDGSTTGRFHPKPVTVQKFERQTLIHEADEPNPDWQDVVPLTNRGFFAGFPDDPAIDAILKNKNAQF